LKLLGSLVGAPNDARASRGITEPVLRYAGIAHTNHHYN